MKKEKFPKGFLFGSATSAHQVEGHQHNDWSEWEKIPGKIDNNDSCQTAADSFNKWKLDIELLKQTKQNAYRFSIEWSRIEPEEGVFNDDAIEHYRRILEELKNNNITSMVTLFHFTLPVWLDKKGGFCSRNFPKYFARFSEVIAKNLGDQIDIFATFNEPNVYISAGFLFGHWYPGKKKDYIGAYKSYRNYIKAHRLSYQAIKKFTKSDIGPVINITNLLPLKDNVFDNFLARLARYFDYEIFIRPILNECDFIGVNYYARKFLHLGKNMMRGDHPYKPNGWRQNQKALADVLIDQNQWKKPIYITENGVPDNDDEIRPEFIEEAFSAIASAIQKKSDVRGYFYWSLLDNFEWSSGYSMKFGLHTIDRKPRKSAHMYSKIIEELYRIPKLPEDA